jgi:Raf kinase inhibitor-like YbhB/YbcL family protein
LRQRNAKRQERGIFADVSAAATPRVGAHGTPASGAAMILASTDIRDQGAIPTLFTCEGQDLSPELHWDHAPDGALSFALLCDDPDAPGGIWRHWAAFDIPAQVRSLPRGAGKASTKEFRQAINDFGNRGYGGPCPPKGHGPHRYRFRLMALSVNKLPARADAHCRDVERLAEKHVVSQCALTGIFER